MFEFRCVKCDAVITVISLQPDKDIHCYNCGAQQPIPADARIVAPDVVAPGSVIGTDSVVNHLGLKVPEYSFTGMVAGLAVVFGTLGAVLFLGVFLSPDGHRSPADGLVFFVCFCGCIFMALYGFLLSCVREIMVNSWHARHSKV